MAEYVLKHDDDQGEIAKMLLDHAGDRAREVKWRPQPNRPHGGVFFVPDDLADGLESDRLNEVDDGSAETEDQEESGEQAPRLSRAAARRAAKADQSKE